MIIGFTGLIGSGKTTAANYLIDMHGYWRTRFAGPLKHMMRALGLSDRQIDGDLKEVPCELLGGKTPRYAMQTIGTEWGRNLICNDLWVRSWKLSVETCSNPLLVCDDVRFPNEAEAIRDLGGKVIRIVRPGVKQLFHASETHDIPFEHQIRNDGTVEELEKNLQAVL